MRCEEFAFPIEADVEFPALKFVLRLRHQTPGEAFRRGNQRAVGHSAGARGAAGRTLWKNAEGNGLTAGELRRDFAEIPPTRGAHAFDVTPVRREIEIVLEDLRLRIVALDFQ